MNFSPRLVLVALLGVPAVLFFVAKRAGEDRPWKLGAHRGCASLAFSPNGTALISSGSSAISTITGWGSSAISTKILWDTLSGQEIYSTKEKLALSSPYGNHIAFPDEKHIARFHARAYRHPTWQTEWDGLFFSPVVQIRTIDGQQERTFQDSQSRKADGFDLIMDAVWSQDGREIVVLGTCQIRRFDARTGRLLSCLRYRPATFRSWPHSSLSPDGTMMAYLEEEGKIASGKRHTFLLDIRTRKTTKILNKNWGTIVFSPHTRFLALNDGKDVQFLRTHDRKFLWTWFGLGGSQGEFHVSPDEKAVVACNGSNCIARDLNNGRELWRVKSPNSPIFALSPDGKTIATLQSGGQIFMWPMPQPN